MCGGVKASSFDTQDQRNHTICPSSQDMSQTGHRGNAGGEEGQWGLLPSLLSPTALLYLEISWYYLVTQIIKMLGKKLLMNQHNFHIIITWFFCLLTKGKFICIRETCSGVEKFIYAVPSIWAFYRWIRSFIHWFIPPVLPACHVQGTLGKQRLNLNYIKLLFVPKFDRHF